MYICVCCTSSVCEAWCCKGEWWAGSWPELLQQFVNHFFVIQCSDWLNWLYSIFYFGGRCISHKSRAGKMSLALQLFVALSGIGVMGPFPWSCSLTTLLWASTNLPSLANMEHKMTYKSLSLFLVVETTAKQDASPWVSRYCKQAKKQASLTLPKGYLRRNRDCSKASRCFQIFSGSSRIQCQWSRSEENNHRVMKHITMSTKMKLLILDYICTDCLW